MVPRFCYNDSSVCMLLTLPQLLCVFVFLLTSFFFQLFLLFIFTYFLSFLRTFPLVSLFFLSSLPFFLFSYFVLISFAILFVVLHIISSEFCLEFIHRCVVSVLFRNIEMLLEL
jgi:hypothetical protein